MKISFNNKKKFVLNSCLLNAIRVTDTVYLGIILFFLFGLFLSGCGIKDPLTKEEREWLKQHDGKIIINNDAGWPPIVDKDKDGKLVGIAIDYQSLIEKKLNFKFQFCEFDNWENNMQKFRKGEIDAHSNLNKTSDRTKFALFTQPYIEIPNAIIVRKEIQGPLSLDKMKGMKIAVTNNYAIHQHIKKNYEYLELVPLDEDIQCLVETSTKSVDAAVVNLAVASYLIEKHGITNLHVAGYTEYKNALSFASRKDLPILNQILDKGLSLITQKEKDAIYNKWIYLGLEYSPFYKSSLFWIVSASILGAIIAIILMVFGWNQSLKRQVKLRTENLKLTNIQLENEIVERNKAEAELRSSQHFNETILNSSPDIIYVYDIVNKINIYSNDGIIRVLGYSTSEIKDMGERMIQALMHPDDFPAYVNETLPRYQSAKDNEFIEHEYRMQHKNGQWCWLNSKEAIFQRQKDGTPIQIFGIMRDITDWKKAEEELRQSAKELRESQRIAHLGSWRLDLATNQAVWTEELYKMYGFDPSLPPPPYTEHMKLFTPYSWETLSASLEKTQKTGIPYELELETVREDGSNGWMWVRGEAIHDLEGNTIGLWGAAQDISERKVVEEQLVRSEEKYKSLFNSINDGICLHEIIFKDDKPVDYKILDINPKYEELTSINKDNAIGALASRLYKSDEAPYLEIYADVAKTGKSVSFETYFEPMDKHFLISVFSPAKFQFATVFQDITERKRSEQKLAQEKEWLLVTLRSIGDGVITTDIKCNVVLINKIAEKLTGWTQEEAVGKDIRQVFNIINANTRQSCENPVEKVLEAKTIVGLANHTNLISKDGTERMIADSGAPIFDANSEIVGVVLVFRDVTETYRIEKQLQHAQKMESVGTLAGGIAHDFNNMLGVITGNLSFALSSLSKNDELYDVVLDAQDGAKQAQNLTQQLLTFAKGGAPVKTTADINQLIKESANFVTRGAKSECKFNLSDDLWTTDVDKGQINQVIGNLIINADQSMPDGGIISVKTENITIEEDNELSLSPGQYIKIAIEDQGLGISEKHLPKIFDPFFTTKQKGSGLGLATSYSIVKRHDGCITVYSEIEKGTIFHIYLPASKKSHQDTEQKNIISHKGHGRILVMDDQESIQKMVGRMLNQMGYETTLAKDGSEAISLYKEAFDSGNPFDLVILDLTIPGGKGGASTIPELLKIDPKVKAIVSSGYSNDPIMSNYRDYGFSGVIPKPYTKEQLSENLDNIFNEY